MEQNPCSEFLDVELAPSGTITMYNLADLPVDSVPDGWKILRWVCFQMDWMPEHEDSEEAQNPYQPDLGRIVILEKL